MGGGLGSVVRYTLNKWINQNYTSSFPLATLSINVIACLILGIIVGLADQKQFLSQPSRLFWTVGFCGGFSTFSTFSNETLTLLQAGFNLQAIFYVVASIVLCISANFIGIALTHLM